MTSPVATTQGPARSQGKGIKPRLKSLETGIRRALVSPAVTVLARLKRYSPRQPAMLGAFPDRATALRNVPRRWLGTYDHADVAAVNFDIMSQIRVWDYPVMFWLDRLQAKGLRVLDAGGHFGTKYIAFRNHLPLDELAWTVYDLPETVAAARQAQARGEVPSAVDFIDDLDKAPDTDLLLASGLLQYLDLPFADFLSRLPSRPRHVILNKVATREGPTVVTLERIGPARVPYQIRNRAEFERQLSDCGYRVLDRWDIPSLAHVIDTHPELGQSVSRGYVLQATD